MADDEEIAQQEAEAAKLAEEKAEEARKEKEAQEEEAAEAARMLAKQASERMKSHADGVSGLFGAEIAEEDIPKP